MAMSQVTFSSSIYHSRRKAKLANQWTSIICSKLYQQWRWMPGSKLFLYRWPAHVKRLRFEVVVRWKHVEEQFSFISVIYKSLTWCQGIYWSAINFCYRFKCKLILLRCYKLSQYLLQLLDKTLISILIIVNIVGSLCVQSYKWPAAILY